LRAQTLPLTDWEYIIIDNASDTPVDSVVDVTWHPAATVLKEPKLGLTWGRLRGIEAAAGDVLVFVDDDNVLAPDYLEAVLGIAEQYQFLGAWGGTAKGEFESAPADWLKPLVRMLAVRTVEIDCWSNLPFLHNSMPTGAGLAVRRRVAEHYKRLHDDGRRPIVLDRSGESLGSAGDEDLAACSCEIGLGVGVFKSLSLTHLIPDARIGEAYVIRLAEGIAWSDEIRRFYYNAPSMQNIRRWPARTADAIRTLTMDRRHLQLRAAERRGRERARRDIAALTRQES
jgi:hypothetical protein